MATFRVTYETGWGPGTIVVGAASFPDALREAHRLLPEATIQKVRMLDSVAQISLRCACCSSHSDIRLDWQDKDEVQTSCPKCASTLLFRRERTIVSSTPAVGAVRLGAPPVEGAEHSAPPTAGDKAKAIFKSPRVVHWHCTRCKIRINCDWKQRTEIQECPECKQKQYVPVRAFAWNSRLIHDEEAKHAAVEAVIRERNEREHRQRREIADRAAQAETQRMQMEVFGMGQLAIASGIVRNQQHFDSLGPSGVAWVRQLADLADALQSDLLAAMDDKTIAEKGVAYGRPAAAGASVVSLLGGYGWAGLAFGALALGARVISNDWQRAKAAEFQAKWARRISAMSQEDMLAFTRVFAYKYPALASMAAGLQTTLS